MQSPQLEPMAVIGAGSWGTALAIQLARAGHPTRLWGRDPAQLEAMQQARRNVRYLPQAAFPACARGRDAIEGGAAGRARCAGGRALARIPRDAGRLEAAPCRRTRASPGRARDSRSRPACCRTKWRTRCSASGRAPCSSGPTFAREVGAGLPTAMTVASRDEHFAKELVSRLSGPRFPRLHAFRHHGRRGGRRREERHRHRLGHRRRHGFRRQYARGPDHARTGRDDAPRRQARRACARPSWGSHASATSYSPAPTINRAIGAWGWRSGRGAVAQGCRSAASIKWSKA